ncbi:MAG: GntR family transcriptional regulator [Pseudomonadota bacterium]
MAERREPFRQALVDLRRRLRKGDLAPGTRITAKEIAEALRLSPTPVREALSRLAGEGVLEERRGDGFFVPDLSAADIAALYRLSEQLLLMSQRTMRPSPRDLRLSESGTDDDPIRRIERLFLAWAAESGSRVTIEAYRTVAVRLAPVRRREVELIDDLAQEAEGLLRLADPARRRARPAAIQTFHRRRAALVEQLADLVRPTRMGGA